METNRFQKQFLEKLSRSNVPFLELFVWVCDIPYVTYGIVAYGIVADHMVSSVW